MPTWILSADQRRGNPEEACRVIAEITAGVRGLVVTPVEGTRRDQGRFRDFVDVAQVVAEDPRLLAWLLDELVDALGWAVDVRSADVFTQDDP